MIKSNLIKTVNKNYGLDFSITGESNKLLCEYLFILFNLVKNDVLDEDSIDLFNDVVKLALKDGSSFDEFANGVISTYLKSKKKGD